MTSRLADRLPVLSVPVPFDTAINFRLPEKSDPLAYGVTKICAKQMDANETCAFFAAQQPTLGEAKLSQWISELMHFIENREVLQSVEIDFSQWKERPAVFTKVFDELQNSWETDKRVSIALKRAIGPGAEWHAWWLNKEELKSLPIREPLQAELAKTGNEILGLLGKIDKVAKGKEVFSGYADLEAKLVAAKGRAWAILYHTRLIDLPPKVLNQNAQETIQIANPELDSEGNAKAKAGFADADLSLKMGETTLPIHSEFAKRAAAVREGKENLFSTQQGQTIDLSLEGIDPAQAPRLLECLRDYLYTGKFTCEASLLPSLTLLSDSAGFREMKLALCDAAARNRNMDRETVKVIEKAESLIGKPIETAAEIKERVSALLSLFRPMDVFLEHLKTNHLKPQELFRDKATFAKYIENFPRHLFKDILKTHEASFIRFTLAASISTQKKILWLTGNPHWLEEGSPEKKLVNALEGQDSELIRLWKKVYDPSGSINCFTPFNPYGEEQLAANNT